MACIIIGIWEITEPNFQTTLPFENLTQTLNSLVEWCINESTSDAQSIAGTQLISSLVNKHPKGKHPRSILWAPAHRLPDSSTLIDEYLPNLWQEVAYNPRQMTRLRARVLKVWVVVSLTEV